VAVMQDNKDEGSPVDVARSYMRMRPPWASPSIDQPKSRTPSGIQLFKEETPHLLGNISTPSSKVLFNVWFLLLGVAYMSLSSLLEIYLENWVLHFSKHCWHEA